MVVVRCDHQGGIRAAADGDGALEASSGVLPGGGRRKPEQEGCCCSCCSCETRAPESFADDKGAVVLLNPGKRERCCCSARNASHRRSSASAGGARGRAIGWWLPRVRKEPGSATGTMGSRAAPSSGLRRVGFANGSSTDAVCATGQVVPPPPPLSPARPRPRPRPRQPPPPPRRSAARCSRSSCARFMVSLAKRASSSICAWIEAPSPPPPPPSPPAAASCSRASRAARPSLHRVPTPTLLSSFASRIWRSDGAPLKPTFCKSSYVNVVFGFLAGGGDGRLLRLLSSPPPSLAMLAAPAAASPPAAAAPPSPPSLSLVAPASALSSSPRSLLAPLSLQPLSLLLLLLLLLLLPSRRAASRKRGGIESGPARGPVMARLGARAYFLSRKRGKTDLKR
jgi:hypothetical protein